MTDNSQERSEAGTALRPVYLTQIIPVHAGSQAHSSGYYDHDQAGIEERSTSLNYKSERDQSGPEQGTTMMVVHISNRYAVLVRRDKLPIPEAAYSLLRAAAVTGNADGGSKGKGFS